MSFFLLTQVALVVSDEGDEATVDTVAQKLGRARFQIEELVRDAARAGIAEIDGDRVRLLPPGRALAVSVRQRMHDAALRSREPFQPFTGYVPERWWPD
jgi:hypothetical protein